MRGVLAFLLVALSLDGARLSAAPECSDRDLAVTVQIHDYVHLPGERLSRASEIVTRMYSEIGVRTEWLGVVQQDTHRTHAPTTREGPRLPIAQLTIIILTPEMTARGRIPEGVLGFAAVPSEGMGRIAYVVYHRVRQVAEEGAASEVDLLGFVMTHETAHLLLGRGSDLDSGLMKGHWARRDFQEIDALKLGFSEVQAEQIRNTLENNPAPPWAIATRGPGSVDPCVTNLRDDVAHEPR